MLKRAALGGSGGGDKQQGMSGRRGKNGEGTRREMNLDRRK